MDCFTAYVDKQDSGLLAEELMQHKLQFQLKKHIFKQENKNNCLIIL